MNKNQNGITLIALVITIIVLLILAGVSIAMLTGDNGLLTQAKEAADETTLAEAKEQVGMVIDEYAGKYYDEKYVNSNKDVGSYGEYIGTNLKAAASGELAKYVVVSDKGEDGKYIIGTISKDTAGKFWTSAFDTKTGTLSPWNASATQTSYTTPN